MYRVLGLLAVAAGVTALALHAVNAAAGRAVEPSFWLMHAMVAVGYGVLCLVVRDRGTRGLRLTVQGIAVGAGAAVLALEWGAADPGATWIVWFGSWAWAPGYVAILGLLPQLLPDGLLVSSRWRPAVWLGVAAVVVAGVSWALWPYEDQDYPAPYEGLTNPVGVEAVSEPWLTLLVDLLLLSAVATAALSVVVRWRGSRGLRRQQLKWLLLGLLGTIGLVAASFLAPTPADEVLAALGTVPLPAAIGVAILRHGLWDVDVVLARSLTYGAVAVIAVGLFVAAVGVTGLLTGGRGGAVSILVVALLAPLLLPLHATLQRRVNRWVHGDEDEPWTELARLGDRLATVQGVDEMLGRVLPDVLQRVRRALHASGVELRLLDGTVLADTAGRVEGLEDGGRLRVPLAYAGEPLGSLEVRRPGGFGPREELLLGRWARQAAVAVHSMVLTRESRRGREAVVLAREEERRRLRRDLHDGVGPSLAALALHVETARDLATQDPSAAAELLSGLAPRMNAVVADVRALVHELRPPTLDELGLTGAVRELADRLSGPVPVRVREDDGASVPAELPAAVEVAAYRVVAEAVTNAVRHADARTIEVGLRVEDATLVVDVTDDGSGITAVEPTGPLSDAGEQSSGDPGGPAVPGLGLLSMRMRCEELGGQLSVRSDTTGTAVQARLPVPGVRTAPLTSPRTLAAPSAPSTEGQR